MDAVLDLTAYVRDVAIRRGVFEAKLSADFIPKRGWTFRRTGYVIKACLRPEADSPIVAELRLPQYVKPETVSIDRFPVGEGRFRIQADVANYACFEKRKTPRKKSLIPELVPQPEVTKRLPARSGSFPNLSITAFARRRKSHDRPVDVISGHPKTSEKVNENGLVRSRSLSIPDIWFSYTDHSTPEAKNVKTKRRHSILGRLPRVPPISEVDVTSKLMPQMTSSDPINEVESGGRKTRLKRSLSTSALLTKLSTKSRAVQIDRKTGEDEVCTFINKS